MTSPIMITAHESHYPNTLKGIKAQLREHSDLYPSPFKALRCCRRSATAPRLWLPASPYLLYPYSRRQLLLRCSTSCIHAVVGNCSCVALPPASMQSSATAPALLYLLHPCSRRQLLLRCSISCIHAVVAHPDHLLFVGSRGFAHYAERAALVYFAC